MLAWRPVQQRYCSSGLPARTRAHASGPAEPEQHSEARPGPEALYLGLERWAVTRNQLDVHQFRRFFRALIERYVDLLEMLACQGARLCIVGVAGCHGARPR